MHVDYPRHLKVATKGGYLPNCLEKNVRFSYHTEIKEGTAWPVHLLTGPSNLNIDATSSVYRQFRTPPPSKNSIIRLLIK